VGGKKQTRKGLTINSEVGSHEMLRKEGGFEGQGEEREENFRMKNP